MHHLCAVSMVVRESLAGRYAILRAVPHPDGATLQFFLFGGK
ncbi:MAG: hypothetical protein OJF50_005509 [Nitrospira sp.]|nr:hypothetical protein [Nitrospira sp.]